MPVPGFDFDVITGPSTPRPAPQPQPASPPAGAQPSPPRAR